MKNLCPIGFHIYLGIWSISPNSDPFKWPILSSRVEEMWDMQRRKGACSQGIGEGLKETLLPQSISLIKRKMKFRKINGLWEGRSCFTSYLGKENGSCVKSLVTDYIIFWFLGPKMQVEKMRVPNQGGYTEPAVLCPRLSWGNSNRIKQDIWERGVQTGTPLTPLELFLLLGWPRNFSKFPQSTILDFIKSSQIIPEIPEMDRIIWKSSCYKHQLFEDSLILLSLKYLYKEWEICFPNVTRKLCRDSLSLKLYPQYGAEPALGMSVCADMS